MATEMVPLLSIGRGFNQNNRQMPISGLLIEEKSEFKYNDFGSEGGYDEVALHRGELDGAPCWVQRKIWRSVPPYSAWGRRDFILSLDEGEQLLRRRYYKGLDGRMILAECHEVA